MLAPLDEISVPRVGPVRSRVRPDSVLADRAYFHPSTRLALREREVRFLSPERRDQIEGRKAKGSPGGRPPPFNTEAYKQRNVVERCFNRIKQFSKA